MRENRIESCVDVAQLSVNVAICASQLKMLAGELKKDKRRFELEKIIIDLDSFALEQTRKSLGMIKVEGKEVSELSKLIFIQTRSILNKRREQLESDYPQFV